ncbi:RNA-binding protein 34 isoform X1 [Nematostella vectensis]|uniref:RNA-binding protein 34 isoform X1 n=1 Tax=Nematostella vectensis TaxID=45351 RepID=UPI0020772481|nr:RNA-binding protein 34 isoform X1 [Nematostella vectensis]
MAAASELAAFAVGEISQVLSTEKKSKKKKADETSNLSSLFSVVQAQKPVFMKVAPTQKKIKETTDEIKRDADSQNKTAKRRKDDDIDSKNETGDLPVELSEKPSSNREAAMNRINKKNPTPTPEDPERLDRTVFVGNLPLTLKKKALKKYFSKYGEVESVRFRSAALAKPNLSRKVGMKRKEFHSERHTLNGYVVYKTAENANQAIASNGEEIDGFHIRVDLASNDKAHDHQRSVFIGNLPFDIEEEPLRELFTTCGNVESVRLIRDRKTGIGKGFGYVLFESKDAVVFALKMNNAEFKGRKIRVFPSKDKPQTGWTCNCIKQVLSVRFRDNANPSLKATHLVESKPHNTRKTARKRQNTDKRDPLGKASLAGNPNFQEKEKTLTKGTLIKTELWQKVHSGINSKSDLLLRTVLTKIQRGEKHSNKLMSLKNSRIVRP